MFFNKRKRRIKELEEHSERLEHQMRFLKASIEKTRDNNKIAWKSTLANVKSRYKDTIRSQEQKFKSLEKDYNKLLDKHNEVTRKYNALKAEVSRLNKAKNRLVKDKDSCKAKIKSITKNKKYYNHRDSKGRFAKKKK